MEKKNNVKIYSNYINTKNNKNNEKDNNNNNNSNRNINNENNNNFIYINNNDNNNNNKNDEKKIIEEIYNNISKAVKNYNSNLSTAQTDKILYVKNYNDFIIIFSSSEIYDILIIKDYSQKLLNFMIKNDYSNLPKLTNSINLFQITLNLEQINNSNKNNIFNMNLNSLYNEIILSNSNNDYYLFIYSIKKKIEKNPLFTENIQKYINDINFISKYLRKKIIFSLNIYTLFLFHLIFPILFKMLIKKRKILFLIFGIILSIVSFYYVSFKIFSQKIKSHWIIPYFIWTFGFSLITNYFKLRTFYIFFSFIFSIIIINYIINLFIFAFIQIFNTILLSKKLNYFLLLKNFVFSVLIIIIVFLNIEDYNNNKGNYKKILFIFIQIFFVIYNLVFFFIVDEDMSIVLEDEDGIIYYLFLYLSFFAIMCHETQGKPLYEYDV